MRTSHQSFRTVSSFMVIALICADFAAAGVQRCLAATDSATQGSPTQDFSTQNSAAGNSDGALPLPSTVKPPTSSTGSQQLPSSSFITTGATAPADRPLAELTPNIEFYAEPQSMVIKGKHGIRIHVKNNTDRAIVFNGENASAKIGDTIINCMDIRDFDELFAAPETFASNWTIGAGETVSDALTVGTWQTVRDMLKSNSPGFKKYGKDEERREQDEGRFGQRVLWPGDSSAGVLLFPCEQSLTGALLSVPVSSFFNNKDKVVITSSARHY